MKQPSTTLLASLVACLALATSAPAQYLTNSFTTQNNVTNSPPAGFVVNLGNVTNLVVFTTNGAVFRNANGVAGSQDSQRNYVATSDYTTYDQTNFEASVDVSVAGAFAPFFGIGPGTPSGANFEPLTSLYIRARTTGGAATVQGTGGGNFSAFGGGITAPYTMKMLYNSTYRVVMFTLIKGAVTNNYGPIPLPTLGSYSVFFGGNNSDTFSNLVIKTPSVAIAVTSAHFTTPAPTLYLGYPVSKQWLAADYNVGSSDITADINTVYSTTDAGICDVVSFGGALTPIAAGVCQIIATNSVLGVAATQTVTVVSVPPAIYMTNVFVGTPGLTFPTNLLLNLGRFDNKVKFTTNGVVFRGDLGDADRSYLSTAYNAYDTVDFQADVDCITNVAFGSFFGIGRGENTAAAGEAANSAVVRIRFSGAQPNVQGVTTTPAAFTAWPAGLGAGPVHVKMLYTVGAGVVAFTISTPTTNQTVSASMSSIVTAASGGGKGVRIFIGGSGSATAFDTFTNLVIKAPSVVVTNLYFGNSPYTNLLIGQTATPLLQVFGNNSLGVPQDVTALSTFTLTNGSPVSISSAGAVTVQNIGTDAVTATYVGPSSTLTATQAVAVLAPTAVWIGLSPIYEGGRPANATLRADFNAALTNVDVTGFNGVSGTWAAQGLGNISVAANVITPVLAGGPEELYAVYNGLTATNLVTVLSAPAYYRTDSFTGASLPSGYYVNKQNASSPGATVTPAGTVFVNAPVNTRDYIISAIPYYNQSNFVATITVKTNAAFGAFFGIGQGLGGGGFGEPPNSMFIRARNAGGNPNVGGGTLFTKWPAGLGDGPIILRMTYVNDTVNLTNAIWFTIITGDTNETVGPFTLPVLAQGYSIFFGGAEVDRAQTYVNLSIVATAPGVPAAPTLTQGVSGSAMTLNWSDGFLLHATDVLGPWTQVMGANSPYTFTVNPTNAQEYFRAVVPYVP